MPKIPFGCINIYICPMKATVSNQEFIIKEHHSKPFTFEVNEKPVELDAYLNRNGMLCFLYNDRSYQAELISYYENDKIAVIKLNNARYEVKLKDDTDILLEQLGISNKSQRVQHIKTPMPGLVLSINVKEGDTVNKGDGLLVLEAMKMETNITSPVAGKIKAINANVGDGVQTGQVLVEFE